MKAEGGRGEGRVREGESKREKREVNIRKECVAQGQLQVCREREKSEKIKERGRGW